MLDSAVLDLEWMNDFDVKLTASQDEIKEGEAFKLTCTVPPGSDYFQQWLHPSREVKGFYLSFTPLHS